MQGETLSKLIALAEIDGLYRVALPTNASDPGAEPTTPAVAEWLSGA